MLAFSALSLALFYRITYALFSASPHHLVPLCQPPACFATPSPFCHIPRPFCSNSLSSAIHFCFSRVGVSWFLRNIIALVGKRAAVAQTTESRAAASRLAPETSSHELDVCELFVVSASRIETADVSCAFGGISAIGFRSRAGRIYSAGARTWRCAVGVVAQEERAFLSQP